MTTQRGKHAQTNDPLMLTCPISEMKIATHALLELVDEKLNTPCDPDVATLC